jgi:hypothetical protein
MFHGHLVYVVVIWSFFPVMVYCTKKNLATLAEIAALKLELLCTGKDHFSINTMRLFCIGLLTGVAAAEKRAENQF